MAGEEVQTVQAQPKVAQPILAAAPAHSATMLPPTTSPGVDSGVSNDEAGTGKSRHKPTKKRSASVEGFGGSDPKTAKITKRRAARACVSCRQRKVRCDVVEGAPCGNCRWDNVDCVVQESRRRKKTMFVPVPHVDGTNADGLRAKLSAAPTNLGFASIRRASDGSLFPITTDGEPNSNGLLGTAIGGGPHFNNSILQRTLSVTDSHLLARLQQAQQQQQQQQQQQAQQQQQQQQQQQAQQQQQQQQQAQQQQHQQQQQQQNTQSSPSSCQYLWPSNPLAQDPSIFPHLSRTQHFLNTLEQPDPLSHLPAFIKPLPTRTLPEDVKYLHAKGALTLPTIDLQNACLRCYVEFVHPYMPLMDIHEFLAIINYREGAHGQVSLLLYQAVMFSSCAFVEMKYLRDAGFSSRKEARRAFFYKTRHLYDLDYESDRLVLVQALLLMSYWYETPDDQKDTWHWMGVAISLAHTIGLHRNPTATNMPMRRQRLWKRIWWCCFMRDRMVALGMRRPTRIKDEDFDVPILDEDDFEIEPLPDDVTLISSSCTLLRDVGMQRELSHMCIAMAKLCILISRMLKTQYSVLIRDRNKVEDTTHSTMMLLPNKKLENMESVASCDLDLMKWHSELPPTCQYHALTPLNSKGSVATLAVQRNLLHMVYHTTVSALHRPQFLPSSPQQVPTASRQVQEMSRMRVRDSAMQITRMVHELSVCRIDRYLQTTGVTVILPAMIIHLLEMKNPVESARYKAFRGFRQCMRVMAKLKDMYSAADYAIGFLDAALQKASIDMQSIGQRESAAKAAAAAGHSVIPATPSRTELNTPPPDNAPYLTSTEMNLFHQNRSYMQTAPNTSAVFNTRPLTAATDPASNCMSTTNKDMDSAVGMSPDRTSSGGSDIDNNMLEVDLGVGNGSCGEDFDWIAVTGGGNFDFHQWLHFPVEGGSNPDDMDITGIVGLMEAQAADEALVQAHVQAQAEEAQAAALAAADDMISWPVDDKDQMVDAMDVDTQAIAQLVEVTNDQI